MATDKDRYAPLKETQPDAAIKKAEQGRAVEQDLPPVWTHEGGMVEHNQSANDMIKHHNTLREKSRNEAERDAPASPETDREHGRNYNELKVERAEAIGKEKDSGADKKKEGERKLTFYEDLYPEQDHDHSRGR